MTTAQLEYDLRVSRNQLERMQKDQTRGEATWKEKIAGAKQRGVRGEPLVKLTEEFRSWKELTQQSIDGVRTRMENLQGQIDHAIAEQQAESRAAMEDLKEKHLAAWLAAGGSDEGFQKAWPAMEQQILVERTTATVAGKTAAAKRNYAGFV